MTNVVVTGANGFIGKNLLLQLQKLEDVAIKTITRDDSKEQIREKLTDVHLVYHLAGINRPKEDIEFKSGNVHFTEFLMNIIARQPQPVKVVMSSSTHALADNLYGHSKKEAEDILESYAAKFSMETVTYRLPGVFGKWCKPNYNSVVATFCYNIARGLPIEVNDPAYELKLVYIDDVIKQFLTEIKFPSPQKHMLFGKVFPEYVVKLNELAAHIFSFKKNRETLLLPEIGDTFIKKLYSTYLSYLCKDDFSYPLKLRTDNRGNLFELLKSDKFGQIFISTTYPGITRGNHYHHTKTEKFCVIKGSGTISFRKIDSEEIIEYKVCGDKPEIVDIPPGYTHNIINTGDDEMITLFWANEIFDPNNTDTVFLQV